jgi:tetratricopeptide (TPR) repeat protein
MRHIFFLILSCALGLCIFVTSEQAQAQSSSGTISIYTYRTVTTRLTNENERLSNVAVTERKNATAADQRWRRAMLQLEEERASGSASAGRVAQLERDATDRKAEFEGAIESLNAQLAAQNDEFQRALRAATAAGTQLLQSKEGQRALELIALGGEESTEAGIQILLAEQEIQDRVDKLRIADRARSIAFTLLGLKGSAPSATTASIINQFDIVIDNDPSRHSDWVELGDLYYEAGRLPDAAKAARRSLNVAETERDLSVSYYKIGDVERAQGDLTGARESYSKSLAIRKNLAAADPSSASLQRDLFYIYRRIALLGDPEFPWSRVVEKLENMASKGILSPADQHYLDEAKGHEQMELEAMQ